MAACKFSPELNFKKSDLPVTCKIEKGQKDVTIALAQLFDSNKTATTLAISGDGQSFTIPGNTATGSYVLEVRIQGGHRPPPPVDIIEDCNAERSIVSIMDPNSKLGAVSMAVLP